MDIFFYGRQSRGLLFRRLPPGEFAAGTVRSHPGRRISHLWAARFFPGQAGAPHYRPHRRLSEATGLPAPGTPPEAGDQLRIIHSANDAIVTINEDHIIVGYNLGAERMLGFPRKEALGSDLNIIIPPPIGRSIGNMSGATLPPGRPGSSASTSASMPCARRQRISHEHLLFRGRNSR